MAKEIIAPVNDVLATTAKVKEAKIPEVVDKTLLASLEDVLHGSPLDEAKHDVAEIKEKFIEHTEVRVNTWTVRRVTRFLGPYLAQQQVGRIP